MIWILYLAAAPLLGLAIYCGRVAFTYPRRPHDFLALLVMIACGLASLFLFIIPTVVLPSRAIGAANCRNWSRQTGYPSKFVVLNWFDEGQCLARMPDGHWTYSDNIIINVPAKP